MIDSAPLLNGKYLDIVSGAVNNSKHYYCEINSNIEHVKISFLCDPPVASQSGVNFTRLQRTFLSSSLFLPLAAPTHKYKEFQFQREMRRTLLIRMMKIFVARVRVQFLVKGREKQRKFRVTLTALFFFLFPFILFFTARDLSE